MLMEILETFAFTCTHTHCCAHFFSCCLEQLFNLPHKEKNTKSCKTKILIYIHHTGVEMTSVQQEQDPVVGMGT